ncbi:MAG: heavy-metal-associated domain-containing protein [Chloroflexi bacterium]|nr:heavy-metal-associated domain-containing protein [Chloroflexota bacterium]
MGIQRVTLAIFGLGCGGGGSLTVERALARLSGVVRVYVNPVTEMAYVEFDPARIQPTDLVRAVQQVGFDADEPVRR